MPSAEAARGPATLTFDGAEIELPAEEPTLGRTALDVSSLSQHGLAVFDPGYADTAAYHSAITFVDGEAGRLFYRGYPVEQLATSFSFLDIAYLLIYGELPSRAGVGGVRRKGAGPQARPARRYRAAFRLVPAIDAPDGHVGDRHRGALRVL